MKPQIELSIRNRLIRRYTPRIRYMAYRLSLRLLSDSDLDDLLSAGFIGLLEAFDRYVPGRDPVFSTFTEFRIRGAILDEIVQKECSGPMGSESKLSLMTPDIPDFQGSLSPLQGHDPLEVLFSGSSKQGLVQAIEQLPSQERVVISLFYFNELSLKEIGEVLSMTEIQVSRLHHHALTLLRSSFRVP